MVGPQICKAHRPIVEVMRQEMKIAKVRKTPAMPVFVGGVGRDGEQRAFAGRSADRQGETMTADAVAFSLRKEMPRLF
jgi:hypothetical protein